MRHNNDGDEKGGGAEEDRTPDLRIANATLSQLSYGPTRSRQCTSSGPEKSTATAQSRGNAAPGELTASSGGPTNPRERRLLFRGDNQPQAIEIIAYGDLT